MIFLAILDLIFELISPLLNIVLPIIPSEVTNVIGQGLRYMADGAVEGWGRIEVQILDLRAHGRDPNGGFKTKPLQNKSCFVADMAKTGGDKFPVAQRIAEGGIGHGGNDGVGIRVAVTGHIDWIHIITSCVFIYIV